VSDELSNDIRSAVAAAAKDSTHFSYARLVELGWDDLLVEEPQIAVAALFEEMGRLLLTGAALDAVVLAAMGGERSATETRVAYPLPGRSGPDRGGAGQLEGLILDGLTDEVTTVLLPTAGTEGITLAEAPAIECSTSPITGLDGSAGWYRITVATTAVSREPDADWSAGLAAGRRALAHQLVGTCEELLRIAVEHVKVREQFGRPLGANQAVQHRLADARVDLAAAEEVVAESWLTETAMAAAAAKGLAGRALDRVGAAGQQVLGGIGYTWEHPWRHPLRRGMLLSSLLGAPDECEEEVGASLVAAGVPRIGGLVEATR
jgi:hypothetical protein